MFIRQVMGYLFRFHWTYFLISFHQMVSIVDSFPGHGTTGGLSVCDVLINSSNGRILSCDIKNGQLLDYKSLREWTGKEKNVKYSVNISCDEGGSVNLPWPFKAINVWSLSVSGCKVEGFLSEMTKTHVIPDELKRLVLTSVSIELPLHEMMAIQNNLNKIPTETDCGQLTLETMILKDVHYELKVSPEERYDLTGKMSNLWQGSGETHATQAKKQCVYRNLRYLDESGSRKSGRYHLKLLPEYSYFPKLEVYNMSRNDMIHVPTAFRNLHNKKFPVLQHLDFSNNALSGFEFEFPNDLKDCHVKFVDLRGNQIVSIPTHSTEQLKTIGTVFVDLRYNPLQCSCTLATFRQYLQTQYLATNDVIQRKLVSDITCTNGSISTGGQMKEVSLLDFSFDNICVT